MRLVLTHPFCWPEVRRGGERLFHDLASYLASAGHDVTAVSTAPRSVRRAGPDPLVRRHPALPELRLPGGVRLDRPVTYLPWAAATIVRRRPELVHGLFHLDGVAARLAAPWAGSPPYLVHIQGIPRRANLERLRAHRLLFRPSVERAAMVVAVSRAAAEALEEEFGIPARPLLNGVFTDRFSGVDAGQRAPEPLVFFPADPNDPRKRLELLATAIARLGGSWRHAGLVVAGRPASELEARLRSVLGARLEVLGPAGPDGMVAAYGRAWVTCLPAVREAFGLVIVESLASGRPCVAVRDGGVPEVMDHEPWLSEPDDVDGLAAALERALADSEEPGSVQRCRRLAEPHDWRVRGPAFTNLYREIVSG